MKLISKMLPILSVGCVASALVPALTSCQGNSNSYYYINGVNKIIPTYDRAKPEDGHSQLYTQEEASRLYFDHVSKNPDIFVQDLICWISYDAYNVREESLTDTSCIKKFDTRLTVEFKDVSFKQVDAVWTASYTLIGDYYGAFSSDGVCSTSNATPIIYELAIKSFEFSVINVPIYLSSSFIKHTFNIFYDSEVAQSIDWSAKAIINGSVDGNLPAHYQKYNNYEVTFNRDYCDDEYLTIKDSIAFYLLKYFVAMDSIYHLGDLHPAN